MFKTTAAVPTGARQQLFLVYVLLTTHKILMTLPVAYLLYKKLRNDPATVTKTYYILPSSRLKPWCRLTNTCIVQFKNTLFMVGF